MMNDEVKIIENDQELTNIYEPWLFDPCASAFLFFEILHLDPYTKQIEF